MVNENRVKTEGALRKQKLFQWWSLQLPLPAKHLYLT